MPDEISSDGIDRTAQILKEGYHEHREVICIGCNAVVDLSGAEDVTEAVKIWNRHIRKNHADTEQ